MIGKGKIKNLEKIVISDPHYEPNVWCRYDKKLDKIEDWLTYFIIRNYEENVKYKGQDIKLSGIEYSILFKRPNVKCELLDVGKIHYQRYTELKKYEIGVDTAQVAFGINDKAEEINQYAKAINNSDIGDLLDYYNPEFAIETHSDGKFGNVQEGIKDGETQFILLSGFFDDYADIQEVEELKDYFKTQFKIEEIELELEEKLEELGEDDEMEV